MGRPLNIIWASVKMLFLSSTLLLASGPAVAQTKAGPAESVNVPGGTARLTFSDEFDGQLDRSRWSTNYTSVLASLPQELQIYTPDSFEAGDGVLRLRTDKRSISQFAYTSGAMTTFGSFSQTFGYFELRAKLPRGQGLWPAFWMLPEDKGWPPEIDIIEFLGGDVSNIYTTYHWVDEKKQHQKDGGVVKSRDWTGDFHTFGVQWRPELIVWYIDGKEVKRLHGSHVPRDPMFLLINTAVGGSWGGPPNASTLFPAYFELDYVRAYQYDDVPKSQPRPLRYLTTVASKNVAAPGDELSIDMGIAVATPTPTLRMQAMIVDATGKEVARRDMDVHPSEAGEYRRTWKVGLPEDLLPGLYIVSIGLFGRDWKPIDWLTNATTFLVK